MNILHINFSDHLSGAYLAMWNLHESLQAQGIQSKVLLLNQHGEKRPEQYVYWDYISGHTGEKIQQWIRKHRTGRQQAIRRDAQSLGLLFSFPGTPYRVHKHPLFAWADVIHLHNVSGFFDWASFFSKCTKKVVWTAHDCGPFDAGFHTRYGIPGEFHPAVLAKNIRVKKKALLSKKSTLEWVFPSRYHRDRAFSGPLGIPAGRVIYHTIDPAVFFPEDKKAARNKLGLDPEGRYLLFAAAGLNRKEKSFRLLLDQLSLISDSGYRLLVLGDGPPPGIPEEVILCGHVKDAAQMCLYYNAADLLLAPSHEESFGLSVAESVFCGTPVIARPVGIAPELGTECVYLAEDHSDEAFIKKMSQVLQNGPGSGIRPAGTDAFGSAAVTNQYLELYLKK